MADRELVDNLIDGVTENLPYDLESEKALLALCLKNTNNINDILNGRLSSDMFYDKRNQVVFESVTGLFMDSKNIDPYIVIDFLKSKGQLEKAGGATYVSSLIDSYAISANASDYASIVYDKYKLRNLIKTLEEVTKQAHQSKGNVNDLVDVAIGRLSAMRDQDEGAGFENLGSILKRNIKNIVKIKNGNDDGAIIKTGFSKVDRFLGGLRPGTLNIIAARPGMGKSAFVINIATNTAMFYKNNVNIFSLEMSKEEIANRIISSRTATPSKKLQQANLSDEELFNITKQTNELAELPIYIMDKSDVNPVSMVAECKKLAAENKLGLVIVDYLQLMSMPSSKGSSYSRQNEISDISRSLKVMAKELKVPVIALSQLSRGAVQRDDHTPQLSDLRDSGAIEQDADSVIFIDRDDYHDSEKRSNPVQEAKIIIAKNRHGEPGNVKLMWEGARTLFYEEDKNSDPRENQVSPYARTTTSDGAASDYHFDEPAMPDPVVAPVEDPGFAPPAGTDVPPMDYDVPDPSDNDIPPENSDAFFDGDFSSDLPEGWG